MTLGAIISSASSPTLPDGSASRPPIPRQYMTVASANSPSSKTLPVFTVLVTGSVGAGKSSMIRRYLFDHFQVHRSEASASSAVAGGASELFEEGEAPSAWLFGNSSNGSSSGSWPVFEKRVAIDARRECVVRLIDGVAGEERAAILDAVYRQVDAFLVVVEAAFPKPALAVRDGDACPEGDAQVCVSCQREAMRRNSQAQAPASTTTSVHSPSSIESCGASSIVLSETSSAHSSVDKQVPTLALAPAPPFYCDAHRDLRASWHLVGTLRHQITSALDDDHPLMAVIANKTDLHRPDEHQKAAAPFRALLSVDGPNPGASLCPWLAQKLADATKQNAAGAAWSNCYYGEASARDSQGVADAFEVLLRHLYDRINSGPPSPHSPANGNTSTSNSASKNSESVPTTPSTTTTTTAISINTSDAASKDHRSGRRKRSLTVSCCRSQ